MDALVTLHVRTWRDRSGPKSRSGPSVALAQVAVWHELQTPYMGVWAAGTNVTRNGRSPNDAFRVSANDDYVDKFLVRYATETLKKAKPGLLLENTAWGQSNEAGLTRWLGARNLKAVGIVGTANAYDAMHLVALAIEQARSTEGPKVRDALENLEAEYKGLIKTYRRPFTAEQHDALTDQDSIMVMWKGGKIIPVAMK